MMGIKSSTMYKKYESNRNIINPPNLINSNPFFLTLLIPYFKLKYVMRKPRSLVNILYIFLKSFSYAKSAGVLFPYPFIFLSAP